MIWDKTTQRAILPPFKGKDRITALAFHPDGNLIAAASADRSIYFWIVLTGREAYRIEAAHTNQISGIAFLILMAKSYHQPAWTAA